MDAIARKLGAGGESRAVTAEDARRHVATTTSDAPDLEGTCLGHTTKREVTPETLCNKSLRVCPDCQRLFIQYNFYI